MRQVRNGCLHAKCARRHDETLANVHYLWNAKHMSKMEKRFFENNAMANPPRTPWTLKAYITALRLFYKFVTARRHTITSELHINTEYLDELQSCDTLLNGWLASLSHRRTGKGEGTAPARFRRAPYFRRIQRSRK